MKDTLTQASLGDVWRALNDSYSQSKYKTYYDIPIFPSTVIETVRQEEPVTAPLIVEPKRKVSWR